MSDTYEKGLKLRKEVLGEAHVNRSMANVDEFLKPVQEIVTRVGWGEFWTRPGLTRKERSLITMGILAALGRSHELSVHVRGALNNGCTPEEIREALIHSGCYAGFPATLEAVRVAKGVIDAVAAEQKG
ncbi:MAG: carboxymuconolactone decarboxylase family protein [Hyphomicrobiaceae bacterium]